MVGAKLGFLCPTPEHPDDTLEGLLLLEVACRRGVNQVGELKSCVQRRQPPDDPQQAG